MEPSTLARRTTFISERLASTADRVAVNRPGLIAGAVVALLLIAVSGRYGYHRDELYFIACGKHLAFGYPDQPPLVPLLSRILPSDSLSWLRLPSALSAGTVVYLTGSMAARLGARASGQWLAAAASALCGFTLGTGHLLSTSTFDLLGWVVITWLVVDERWVLAGVVGGLTFEANALVGFLVLALAVCRPRSRGPWVAGVIALIIGAPYLLWQAQHGWPQLSVAHNIAQGGSKSSVPRSLLIPLFLVQTGPWLAPIWLVGLRRILRDQSTRYLGLSFLLLLALFVATGGKPYYLAGLVPLLFAAGAQPVLDALPRMLIAAGALLSLPSLLFALPVLPVAHADFVIALDPDAGETIGWPSFAAQVARLRPALVITSNYGEAGALQRYTHLDVYSGHNAYGYWGPPAGSAPALLIGIHATERMVLCRSAALAGRIRSPEGLNNDENGVELTLCSPRAPWAQLWPTIRHVD